MYKSLVRPVLFLFDPERIHHLSTSLLSYVHKIAIFKAFLNNRYKSRTRSGSMELMGLNFPNRIGLAAGFDKNATLLHPLASLGFGFIEVGTVTPKPQSGNSRPRLFRLTRDQGLLNRMGFNNHGVHAVVERLRQRPEDIVVGGNIGKNKVTPNENALEDYVICLEELYDYVDYFVVNVSSPNTPGLRELQEKGPLTEILQGLQEKIKSKTTSKPLLLKIAPDLTDRQLSEIVMIMRQLKLDGVVATNTTIDRGTLKTSDEELTNMGPGGISGLPLKTRSTQVIRTIRKEMGPDFPIIGVGGIFTVQDALEKINAGADLIQMYSGFVYEGPSVVRKIHTAIVSQ